MNATEATQALHAALKLPDDEASHAIGVSVRTVYRMRERAGITTGPRNRLDEVIDRLGTIPDQDLADEIGVNVRLIQRERTRRNIDACRGPGRPPAPEGEKLNCVTLVASIKQSQKHEIGNAAKRRGLSVSAYLREELDRVGLTGCPPVDLDECRPTGSGRKNELNAPDLRAGGIHNDNFDRRD